MWIRAGYEISLQCEHETPLMALLSIHPSRANDLRTPAIITSNHRAPLVAQLDEFGNLRTRTAAPAGVLKLTTDFVVEDSGEPDIVAPLAEEVPVTELPEDALSFRIAVPSGARGSADRWRVDVVSTTPAGVPGPHACGPDRGHRWRRLPRQPPLRGAAE